MSAFLISALVEDAELDLLGAKEALTMAVEPFGWVRLVRVEVLEDEQLAMPGPRPSGLRRLRLPRLSGNRPRPRRPNGAARRMSLTAA